MKDGWIYLDKCLTINEILKKLNLEEDKVDIKKVELYQNKHSKAKLSLSKIYKDNEYPFHSDGVQYSLPPRFIIIQNQTQNHYKTKTLLIDGLKLSQINKTLFYNSIFKIEGNNDFKERTVIVNSSKINNKVIIRYNPLIMKPNIPNKENLINDCIKNFKEIIKIEWKPKSTLIIDNWRMLHSREKNLDLNLKRELTRTEIYTYE